MRHAILVSVVSVLAIAPFAPIVNAASTSPGPVRFVPQTPEAAIRIDAAFKKNPDVCAARQPRNLHAAYKGTLEVGRRADGYLYLVTELTFDEYLNGIAEVPRDWPLEALKAQVVAARTYAMGHMNPSTALAKELNFNLCATDACQVYRGLSVERGAWGAAWSQAVRETKGEILEHNGKPADALYFSTSNGTTLSNKDVFGGSPLPYLQPVQELDDSGSPLSNWTVRMPLKDLTETLKRGGSFAGPSIEKVAQEGDKVVFSGGGSTGSLPLDTFRIRLNNHAVCLTPKRYPTAGPEGKAYPQVVPSKWMTVRQEGGDVVMTGRGWGHGVGMVQWGLKGKSERGMNYKDMLAHYYGGLRPISKTEPGKVRIGLATGIENVTIERQGEVSIIGAQVPAGSVTLRSGPAVDISQSAPILPVLELNNPALTPQANTPSPINFSFDLSSAARISLRIKLPTGEERTVLEEPRNRGPGTISFNPTAAGIASGPHEIMVIANDGVDEVGSPWLPVSVAAAPTPSPSPSAKESLAPKHAAPVKDSNVDGLRIAGAALLAVATLMTAGVMIRRTARRSP